MPGPTATTPAAWYQADSLALNDGDPVSTWTDSSGNGRDVTGTGATRPTFKTNILLRLPVVRFDETASTILDYIPGADWITGTGLTLVVVFVARSAGDGNTRRTVSLKPSASADWNSLGGLGFGMNTTDGEVVYRNGSAQTSQSFPGSGTVQLHAITHDGTGNTHRYNRADATDSTGTATGTFAVRELHLGASGSGGEYRTVDIAEVLIYDVALTTELAWVEEYLYNKYFATATTRVTQHLGPGLNGPGCEDRGLDLVG